MSIQFAHLIHKTFTNDEGSFHLYRMRCHGGRWYSAIYIGNNPPKALKTVEYELTGEWQTHPTYGKQFRIQEYKRSERINHLEERSIVRHAIKKLDH